MEGAIAGFLIATGCGLFLTFLTYLTARRSGLAPAQATLIDTLQDNAKALDEKVRLLEEQVARETAERIRLQTEVTRLRTAIADLAAENAELRRRLGMPRVDDR